MNNLDYAELLEIYAKMIKEKRCELTDSQKVLIAELGRSFIKKKKPNCDKSRLRRYSNKKGKSDRNIEK